MLKEEKSGGKESISVLDDFTLDREKLIGPQIYQFLLNAIVTVRLSPGIGLKEKEVIKRLGVSRTPIREALLRLEDEGLVQIFPQSGTYVSKIKIEAVLESQFIREALECSVARYAARNRNDELLESLSRKLEDYETALNDDEVKLMYEKDEEFHRTLANFCFPKDYGKSRTRQNCRWIVFDISLCRFLKGKLMFLRNIAGFFKTLLMEMKPVRKKQ